MMTMMMMMMMMMMMTSNNNNQNTRSLFHHISRISSRRSGTNLNWMTSSSSANI